MIEFLQNFIAFGVFLGLMLYIFFRLNHKHPDNRLFSLVGGILSIVMNYTYATILTLEFPKEHYLTERIIRYRKQGGWREVLSRPVAKWIMDVDPDHLRE